MARVIKSHAIGVGGKLVSVLYGIDITMVPLMMAVAKDKTRRFKAVL